MRKISDEMDVEREPQADMTTKPQQLPGILRTKLHRPPTGPDIVNRTRLSAMMDRGLATPLTLVSAPAGYGKSVSVAQWAEGLDRPSAWVSLDEGDSDLRRFLQYFVAAVDSVCAGACQETQSLLSVPDLPPAQAVADVLINELEVLDVSCTIVLDDYHVVERQSPVHQVVARMLKYPPKRIHLALIARRDPPLPLLALRADNRVTEVRLRDLRFSQAEIAEFLALTAQTTVSKDALANVEREIEGWPAGLRLLALALRRVADAESFLNELSGGLPQTEDYLLNEVLAGLPPDVRVYMLKSSLLARFCPDLLDAISGPDATGSHAALSGGELAELLQRENVFTIQLDARGDWLRYHRLFRQLLQQQLRETVSAQEIADLHRRAAEWFESRGLIDESIEHSLAAGMPLRAAETVERHRKTEQDSDRWYVVERWLDMLPGEVKLERPGLLLAGAWGLYERFRLAEIPPVLERADSLLHDSADRQVLAGELSYLRGALEYWAGKRDSSRRHLEYALARVPDDRNLVGGLIRLMLGLARCMSGEKEPAVRELNDRLREVGPDGGIYASRLRAGLNFIHLLSGDLHQAEREALRMRTLARKSQISYTEAWSWYMEACCCLHAGDLTRAVRQFTAVCRRRYILHMRATVDAMAGLALSQQLMQQGEAAVRSLNLLDEFVRQVDQPRYGPLARSARARVNLLRGDLPPAAEWERDDGEAPVAADLFIWQEVPAVTRARVLIALGSRRGLEAAAERLREVRDVAVSCRFTNHAIEAAVLQAVAQQGLGHTERAVASLNEAAKLASPGGWIRPFIEVGPVVGEMLQQLARESIEADVIRRALQATQQHQAHASLEPEPNHDALSNRELDVLGLLAQRLSNKEIAVRLFISTHTVNDHLKRIYRKLGASNRRQAVARAVELGVLSHRTG